MRKFFLTSCLLLIFGFSSFAQILNVNLIDYSEFKNIEIDGVSIVAIIDTGGNKHKLQEVLEGDFTYERWEIDPAKLKVTWKGHRMGFTSYYDMTDKGFIPDTTAYHYLDGIELLESCVVTFKGKTIRVGDHESVLGENLIKNNHPTLEIRRISFELIGEKGVVFGLIRRVKL
ncbi:hypothetical protein [Aureibacter tunicatorum]|uniref:Lipocalin-like domain-containing protein n=1 Tax=Aureibacter tunicatorum TaxID=866807 RepID=A0AAE3XTG2_9BACT|nr:hypothetical protein [Aureibacter tunicatorum]MDR6241778.1 hypothetical protein [Aureibacter tunicatorum]BDD07430.1 hypothetical protein AUTU_49130 [Aureibacter tunicatorum]